MVFGKHINKYYIRYAGWLLLGLAALITVDFLQLRIPEYYRMVINGVNSGHVLYQGSDVVFDMAFLVDHVCMPMVVTILCMVTCRFIWRVCIYGSAIKMEADVRNEMFNHARFLSQQYYQVNKVGNLMSLFTNDLDTVQECYGDGFLMVWDAVLLGSLAVIKMFRMSPIMTVLCLIPMGLLFWASTIIGKRMTIKWDKRQETFSKLSDFSQESFSGIAVIKAFVKEAKELMAFGNLNKENEEANVDFVKTATLMRVVVTLFVESVTCVILGYGGYLVYRHVFDAGMLMEFIGYFTAIVWPIMAVSELIDMHSRGKASLTRISELLDAEVDVKDAEGVTSVGMLSGDIEFRNLTFRYPGAEYDALQNVSFCIKAGEQVGIAGKTGAGKTTIVDLLLRTYNVPDGTILMDGHDVNSIPIREVRASCAYVPQDNFLFSDTIANNIGFSSDNASLEDVVEAAKLADIHENISEFVDTYQTMLGERGVTVSGGQKQRISIARALMRNAPILILDDSVSAVDTATERNILGSLKESRAGRTTILIAHRVSTIEQMDKIILIDEGRVVAVGTHTELYETCEEYRNMVDLQKLEEGGEGNA